MKMTSKKPFYFFETTLSSRPTLPRETTPARHATACLDHETKFKNVVSISSLHLQEASQDMANILDGKEQPISM
ncbi:hypothetical protein WAI453_004119 [Rhynchosporium graminicola]